MSALGMTATVLATQLAEAVLKDEAPEEGGFDLSSGLFGRNVSDWIRATAKELDARASRERAWKECAEHQYGLLRAAKNPDDVDYPTAGALMDLESLQLVLLRPLRASTSQQRSNAQSDACTMPEQGPHQ